MSYRAINDSVIVEIPQVQRQVTREESGIILVQDDKSNKSTLIGVITSIGEGKFDTKTGVFIPPPVKLGDRVVLSLSTGVALDDTHRMIRTDDIFAVIE